MEFLSSRYQYFTKDFQHIANQFNLDPDKLKVEFYTPKCQAILVEQVEGHAFKIHINLEENRIISIQMLGGPKNGSVEYIKEKYRKYMK
ncbi:MAG: hypothetical protein ACE5HX_05140 [bacterium]